MVPMRSCSACGFEHPEQVVVCPSTQQVIGSAVLGGRYRLDRLIAVGGIGAVYDARALHIDRRVAVKRLLPAYTSDPEVVRRFQREARAAGRIEHPNVVEVLDFGVGEDGVPFLVMEFLEGDTLAARIDRSPGQRMPYGELVPIALDVLEALQHAHAHGIVHRDLKPENIFLAHRANNQTVVKLVDLGISKAIGSTSQAITQSGSALGTPHYMAPEQLRGERDVDGRVDLYALGIVMYRALSGAFPFDGRTFEHLVTRILDGTCAPLSAVVPGVPPGLSEAVGWAMQRDRDKRAASAEALAEALLPFAPETPRALTHPRLSAHAASAPSVAPQPTPPTSPLPRLPTPPAPVVVSPPETTTTRRPSAGDRPVPFRIDSTAEMQASATLPSVAASSSPPRRPGPSPLWLVVAAVVLVGGGLAAYFGLRGEASERPALQPPTGGLAGSPHSDLPSPTAPSLDAGAAGPTNAGSLPADAGTLAADAGAPVPPAPADAAPEIAPPAPDAAAAPADAAAREADTAVREADATVDPRPDAAPRETTAVEAARDDGGTDDAARLDVAAETPPDHAAPAPDAAAATQDAAAARPTVEQIAQAFLRLASLVPRCAEGEGAGEFRVSARVRGSDGRVRDVDVQTAFSDQARQCVSNLVAGLSFPPFGDDSASFEHTFVVSGEADAGSGDAGVPTADDIRRRLRRAQRNALACLQGSAGAVELLVRIDGEAQRATLQSIEGAVTPEEETCLRGVVESTEVPAYPGTLTVPMRVR